MGALADLLEVQEHDSAIDRLRARREKLPERQQLVERAAEAAELETQLGGLREQRDEVSREEHRLDDNVTALETRINEVEAEMYSGHTSSPRELQAMQADLEQLRRQRSSLEDQELDAMERRESLEGEIAQLEEKVSGIRTDRERLTQALSDQEQEIDGEISQEAAARDDVAVKVPSDLLETYQSIRERSSAVGAARLVGGTCQGCHLALPAMEVDRIKRLAEDEVARCEQCGAILVRS